METFSISSHTIPLLVYSKMGFAKTCSSLVDSAGCSNRLSLPAEVYIQFYKLGHPTRRRWFSISICIYLKFFFLERCGCLPQPRSRMTLAKFGYLALVYTGGNCCIQSSRCNAAPCEGCHCRRHFRHSDRVSRTSILNWPAGKV